jgi:hypothetical protein
VLALPDRAPDRLEQSCHTSTTALIYPRLCICLALKCTCPDVELRLGLPHFMASYDATNGFRRCFVRIPRSLYRASDTLQVFRVSRSPHRRVLVYRRIPSDPLAACHSFRVCSARFSTCQTGSTFDPRGSVVRYNPDSSKRKASLPWW